MKVILYIWVMEDVCHRYIKVDINYLEIRSEFDRRRMRDGVDGEKSHETAEGRKI